MAKLEVNELQTRFARGAADLATDFDEKMSALRIGGRYRPVLMAPEVPSTGGGAQAGQPILFVDEAGQRVLVGHANVREKQVDLRSIDFVAQVHLQRNGASLRVSAEEYERFLVYARRFFEGHDLRVDVRYPPSVPPPAPTPAKRSRTLLFAAIALVVVAAGAALAFALRR